MWWQKMISSLWAAELLINDFGSNGTFPNQSYWLEYVFNKVYRRLFLKDYQWPILLKKNTLGNYWLIKR